MLVPGVCSTGPTKNLRPGLGISRSPVFQTHGTEIHKNFQENYCKIFFIFQTSRPLAPRIATPIPYPFGKNYFLTNSPSSQQKILQKNSPVLLRKDEPPIAVRNPDQQNAIRSKNIGSARSLPFGLHRRCNHYGEPRGPMLPCHKGRTL